MKTPKPNADSQVLKQDTEHTTKSLILRAQHWGGEKVVAECCKCTVRPADPVPTGSTLVLEKCWFSAAEQLVRFK